MDLDAIKRSGINKYSSALNDRAKKQVLEEVTANLKKEGKSALYIAKITKEIIESQTNSATLKNTQLAQQVLLKMQGKKK
jgi:hypothetical protein